MRIEFAGYDVSGGAGQELNSLSMYAVGSGTTLEYVQTLAGLDDSFEWWGGAVDGRYLVSYESGDDHFDWTEGYRGRNQFLIGFQSTRLDPAADAGQLSSRPAGLRGRRLQWRAVATLGFASQPFSMPVFANFTLVGPGTGTHARRRRRRRDGVTPRHRRLSHQRHRRPVAGPGPLGPRSRDQRPADAPTR